MCCSTMVQHDAVRSNESAQFLVIRFAFFLKKLHGSWRSRRCAHPLCQLAYRSRPDCIHQSHQPYSSISLLFIAHPNTPAFAAHRTLQHRRQAFVVLHFLFNYLSPVLLSTISSELESLFSLYLPGYPLPPHQSVPHQHLSSILPHPMPPTFIL